MEPDEIGELTYQISLLTRKNRVLEDNALIIKQQIVEQAKLYAIIDHYKAECQKAIDQKARIEHEFIKLKDNKLEKQVRELQIEIEGYKRLLYQYQAITSNFTPQNQVTLLQRDISLNQIKINDLQSNLKSTEEKLVQARNQISLLQTHITELECTQESQNFDSSELDQARDRISSLQAEILKLGQIQQISSSKTQELEKAKQKICCLKSKVVELKQAESLAESYRQNSLLQKQYRKLKSAQSSKIPKEEPPLRKKCKIEQETQTDPIVKLFFQKKRK